MHKSVNSYPIFSLPAGDRAVLSTCKRVLTRSNGWNNNVEHVPLKAPAMNAFPKDDGCKEMRKLEMWSRLQLSAGKLSTPSSQSTQVFRRSNVKLTSFLRQFRPIQLSTILNINVLIPLLLCLSRVKDPTTTLRLSLPKSANKPDNWSSIPRCFFTQ